MKKILLVALSVLLACGIYSCKKGTEKPTIIKPSSNSVTMLNTIFADNAVKSKTVTIDAGAGGSFYGNSGTRYQFLPNSFRKANGTIVAGNVDIEVAEYLKRGDMIFSKALPISDGEPLVSGGEVFVSATQNGEKLSLRMGFPFTANIPQAGVDSNDMKLFLGTPVEDNANKVNWKEFKKDTIAAGPAGVEKRGDTLGLFTDRIGWCNADRFLSNPNYQSFKIKLSGVTMSSTAEMNAYALYDDYNGAWPMFADHYNGDINEGHVPDIPVHFVITVVVNDEFYGGILGATPKTGETYTVNMTKVDPKAFKVEIDKL